MARSFRFSLVSSLLFLTTAGILLAVVSNPIISRYRISKARSTIESNGRFFAVDSENVDSRGIVFERHYVGDSDLPNLKMFPNVSRVSLSGLGIDDNSLRRALGAKSLSWLYLVNTSITTSGISELKDSSLQCLFLSGNNIVDSHMKAIATLKMLDHLQIMDANISNEGMALVTKVTGIRSLDIGYLHKISELNVQNFKDMKLTSLRIRNIEIIGDGIAEISGIKTIESLCLPGTGVSDQETKFLANLPQLQFLDLSGCPVGDESARHLSKLNKLKGLDLRWTNYKIAGLAKLSRISSLRRLTISSSVLNESELNELKLMMPQCVIFESASPNLYGNSGAGR